MGDVAGHGVAATAQAGQLRHSLRVYAHEGYSLADALTRLNELVLDDERARMATMCLVRIDDDPATSALTPHHELRGSPSLFVTDGSAVPTSLTVNPSLTIAALAERASRSIGRRAADLGVDLGPVAPPPGRS